MSTDTCGCESTMLRSMTVKFQFLSWWTFYVQSQTEDFINMEFWMLYFDCKYTLVAKSSRIYLKKNTHPFLAIPVFQQFKTTCPQIFRPWINHRTAAQQNTSLYCGKLPHYLLFLFLWIRLQITDVCRHLNK